MIKAAFAKAVINDLWPVPEGWGYHDDVEARTAYFESDSQRLLFTSIDISILDRQRDETLRDEIAKRTGVPVEDVLVHCKQTHNAVPYTLVYLDKIAETHRRIDCAKNPACPGSRDGPGLRRRRQPLYGQSPAIRQRRSGRLPRSGSAIARWATRPTQRIWSRRFAIISGVSNRWGTCR